MTTNLAAIAGPSKHFSAQTKVEPVSPLLAVVDHGSIDDMNGVSVSKPGLSVGENGQVVKVPAFLNKLFRWVVGRSQTDRKYGLGSRD